MGIEYMLSIPPANRPTVRAVLARELPALLLRVDPRASEDFPNVFATIVEEGVLLCDNLSDESVAAQVIRELIDLLLLHSESVSVTAP